MLDLIDLWCEHCTREEGVFGLTVMDSRGNTYEAHVTYSSDGEMEVFDSSGNDLLDRAIEDDGDIQLEVAAEFKEEVALLGDIRWN